MIFQSTKLPGAFVLDLELHSDERGFFARSWCEREFKEHGLNPRLVQCNLSFNRHKGTLRGMHYQQAPFAEAKLVRCIRGALYDVIIDLRPESPTYKQYFGVELTPDNRRALYIPEGFGHGFLTLEDDTEVFYQMSEFYSPEHARGIRWNDRAIGIEWPAEVRVISQRDREYPDYVCVAA
jgi:dTDP-4-dehydrorhamnose 3,5-epimerase